MIPAQRDDLSGSAVSLYGHQRMAWTAGATVGGYVEPREGGVAGERSNERQRALVPERAVPEVEPTQRAVGRRQQRGRRAGAERAERVA